MPTPSAIGNAYRWTGFFGYSPIESEPFRVLLEVSHYGQKISIELVLVVPSRLECTISLRGTVVIDAHLHFTSLLFHCLRLAVTDPD